MGKKINSFSDLTEEQLRAIGLKQKPITRQSDTSIIDQVTGEILRQEHTETFLVEREPDYIKLYYSTWLTFNGITDIPADFLMALSHYITWAGAKSQMRFVSSAPTIDAICEMLNIKRSMYTKYIKRCTSTGLLIASPKYRGCYDVNPFFLARGKWEDIKGLRATFDFKQGKWLAIREYDDSIVVDATAPVPQDNPPSQPDSYNENNLPF